MTDARTGFVARVAALDDRVSVMVVTDVPDLNPVSCLVEPLTLGSAATIEEIDEALSGIGWISAFPRTLRFFGVGTGGVLFWLPVRPTKEVLAKMLERGRV